MLIGVKKNILHLGWQFDKLGGSVHIWLTIRSGLED